MSKEELAQFIRDLKAEVVKSQRYEAAAHLRDIERTFFLKLDPAMEFSIDENIFIALSDWAAKYGYISVIRQLKLRKLFE